MADSPPRPSPLIFALLVGLLGVSSSLAQDVDALCVNGDGLQPHPSVSCSPHYIVCVNGQKVDKQCPIGLTFDALNLRCARSVDGCDFDCSTKEDGMYSKGCTADFWYCWNKMATSRKCSTGLYFDMDFGECNYKHAVRACGGKRPVTTTTAPSDEVETTTINFNCAEVENGDHQYVTGECSDAFVSCSNGYAFARQCPGGLVFDPSSRFCDRRGNVAVCGGTPATPTEKPTFVTTEEPTTTAGVCSGQAYGALVKIADCASSYIRCVDGRATNVHCPFGQVYDEVIGCDPPSWIPDCPEFDEREREEMMTSTYRPTTTREITTERSPPSTTTQSVDFDCTKLDNGDHQYVMGECSDEFVSCSNGIAFARHCSGGLVFDPSSRFCDYRGNVVVCGGAPATTTEEAERAPIETTTVNSICEQLEDGDHQYTMGECSDEFVSCSNGNAFPRQCPGGLVFDPSSGFCDRRANVIVCGGAPATPTVKPTYTPIETTTADSICEQLEDGDHQYTMGECSDKFVSCSNGNAFPRQCPGGLVFDPSSTFCDRRANVVVCGGSPATTTEEAERAPIETTTVNPICEGLEDGDHQLVMGECSVDFVSCSNGNAFPRQCPGGLVFDPSSGFCDRRANVVVCGGAAATTTEAVTRDPIEAATINFDCGDLEDGDYQYMMGECSYEFVSCSNGNAFARQCPGGLVFDPSTGFCDRRANVVVCGGAPATPTEEATNAPIETTTIDFDCADFDNGDHQYVMGECSGDFVSCSNGNAFPRQCPGGLVFDPSSEFCDRRANVVVCGGTPVAPTEEVTRDPIETTTINFDCSDLDNGDHSFVDGECSNDFVSCSNGIAFPRQCPGGLVFDPSSEFCDRRTNVAVCGGTPATPTEGPTTSSGVCSGINDATIKIADCISKFIRCVDGRVTTERCPIGQVFDEVIGCDTPAWIPGCPDFVHGTTTTQRTRPSTTTRRFDETTTQRFEPLPAHRYDTLPAQQPQQPYNTPIARPYNAPSAPTQRPYGPPQNPPTGGCAQRQVLAQCVCVLAPGCVCQQVETFSDASFVPQFDCVDHSEIAPCTEEFNFCSDGQTFPSWCEPGHVFDAFYQGCIHASEAPGCGPPTDFRSNDVVYGGNGGYGSFGGAAPAECHEGNVREIGLCVDAFESCEFGRFEHKFCPVGTLFDEYHCIAPCQAGRCCPVYPESEPEPIFDDTLIICEDRTTAPGGPCNEQYYECVNNAWTLQWCPPSLVYCPVTQHCLPPTHVETCEIVEVESDERSYGGGDALTYGEPEFEPLPEDDVYEVECITNSRVAKSICIEEFFLCVDNEWTSGWCGEGLVFDADAAICLPFASIAVCQPIVEAPPPQAPICIDTSTAPAGPCHEQYYECVANAWTLQRCANGLIYCPATHHCLDGGAIATCEEIDYSEPLPPVFAPICPTYGQASPYCHCQQY